MGFEFHRESFLAGLSVVAKSSVSKAVDFSRVPFLDHTHNPAGIERPEFQVRYQNGDSCACFNRGIRPAEFEPRDVEHFRALETIRTFAELYAIVVDGVSARRLNPGCADFAIREGAFLL